jgi:hypothetical protein
VLLAGSLFRRGEGAVNLLQKALTLMLPCFQGLLRGCGQLIQGWLGRSAEGTGDYTRAWSGVKNPKKSGSLKSVPLFKQFFGQRSKFWK